MKGVLFSGSAIGMTPVSDCIADGKTMAATVTPFLRNKNEEI